MKNFHLYFSTLEQFQFETLRVPNHTASRFAEKTRFFHSLWAGRRAAASRFTFFKGETLYARVLGKMGEFEGEENRNESRAQRERKPEIVATG